MLETLIAWTSATPINAWVLSWHWTWVILEILHFIGLALLMGGLLVIDLRYIGFLKGIPLYLTKPLLVLVFIGFLINLTSGTLFFFGDPERYAINIAFRIKLVLLFTAGLNTLWFYFQVERKSHTWADKNMPPTLAKVIASSSLALWFGVLICGRLIPYVGTG